jgi:hypothetical protein
MKIIHDLFTKKKFEFKFVLFSSLQTIVYEAPPSKLTTMLMASGAQEKQTEGLTDQSDRLAKVW